MQQDPAENGDFPDHRTQATTSDQAKETGVDWPGFHRPDPGKALSNHFHLSRASAFYIITTRAAGRQQAHSHPFGLYVSIGGKV